MTGRQQGQAVAQQGLVGATITEDDDVTFPPTNAVWVGGTGDLHAESPNGQEITITAIPDGTWLWISIVRVFEDSTATNLVGFR